MGQNVVRDHCRERGQHREERQSGDFHRPIAPCRQRQALSARDRIKLVRIAAKGAAGVSAQNRKKGKRPMLAAMEARMPVSVNQGNGGPKAAVGMSGAARLWALRGATGHEAFEFLPVLGVAQAFEIFGKRFFRPRKSCAFPLRGGPFPFCASRRRRCCRSTPSPRRQNGGPSAEAAPLLEAAPFFMGELAEVPGIVGFRLIDLPSEHREPDWPEKDESRE